MNAQSNHPINDTTDPQFLGPEAGQQAGGKAGGESQSGSELDANGSELHRYFSIARGALISVRSNGVTLCRQVDDDWRVLSRKKVCLLYTSDAADARSSVDLGGRRIIKKKKPRQKS